VRRLRLADGTWLLHCPRCLLGWWNWPAFDPATFYDQVYFQSAAEGKGYNDYAALQAGLRRTAYARLRRISRYCTAHGGGRRPPHRLLELGCGTGVFLDAARQAGWTVSGVEVSPYAAAQARQRGLDVRTHSVEDFEWPAGDCDCVALWDVLEHLCDPAGVLRAAGRALRPGGILALSTGDVTSLCARMTGPRWHLFNLPEHLFFFSPAALDRLLRAAGCEIRALTREWLWLPAEYLCERLHKAHGLPAPLATALQRTAAALGVRLLPATLLDVIGVYAVRTDRR
jgi:SAM-dependent methyltransferase